MTPAHGNYQLTEVTEMQRDEDVIHRDGYRDAEGKLWPSAWHAVRAGAIAAFGRDPETGARVQLLPTEDGGYRRVPPTVIRGGLPVAL